MQRSKPDEMKKILSSPWLVVDLMVLYLVWSFLGMLLEGGFTWFTTGRWETHVVSMIGPFCIIYGLGAALYYISSAGLHGKPFYVRFLIYASVGTFFELLCGLILMYGLNVRAWDYTNNFMNYKGLICPIMFFVWGALGMGFDICLPVFHAWLCKLHRPIYRVTAWILVGVMLLDFIFTGICIFRWKNRRYGVPASSDFMRTVDEAYPDAYMQHRFIEWHFLDEGQLPGDAQPAETQGAAV